jgi:hypothetical protein
MNLKRLLHVAKYAKFMSGPNSFGALLITLNMKFKILC